MAIVATIPEQVYSPRNVEFQHAIPSGVKAVRVTFSRVNWPAGSVGTSEILFPDGTSTGVVGYAGGSGLARDGTATSSTTIANGGSDLPAGTYTVRVSILQTLRTAITIERL